MFESVDGYNKYTGAQWQVVLGQMIQPGKVSILDTLLVLATCMFEEIKYHFSPYLSHKLKCVVSLR